MGPLASWDAKVHEIPRAGIAAHKEATQAECAAIAKEIDVIEVLSLTADYQIKNAGKGRFKLTGTLTARLLRTCVVSLEPTTEKLIETLDCIFLPPEKLPTDQAEEEEILTAEEYEPINGDTLDVSRIVLEVLSAGLNPFPRSPGAELEKPQSSEVEAASSEHPFAALSKLAANPDKQSPDKKS